MSGWSATPRGRRELAAVGLFCLAFAVVPLLTTELYPFSRAPMFADAPRRYCDYAVVTPDGRRLTEPQDLARFGLQRNYWGNPLGVGVGFEPAESVDVFGKVADERQRVRRLVSGAFEAVPGLGIRRCGAERRRPDRRRPHGRRASGERWRVDNPNYRRARRP